MPEKRLSAPQCFQKMSIVWESQNRLFRNAVLTTQVIGSGLKINALNITKFLQKRNKIVQTKLWVKGLNGAPESDDVRFIHDMYLKKKE